MEVADEAVPPYETIATNIRDAVYTLDEEGRITWVNETSIQEFDVGYERHELVGSYVSKILRPTDIETCLDIIKDLLTSDRESRKCEVTILAADGREIPAELNLTLLPFEDGEFQGTLGIARDITERKRREQRLTVLNRVLRHNVRTDMNVIVGVTDQLLNDSELAEHHRDDLTEIRSVAENLVELGETARRLDELIERDRLTVREMDVCPLVRTVGDRYRTAYPEATITYSLPDIARVMGHDWLDLALDKVVDSAIVHNDSAEPTVEITVSDRAGEGVEISVRDDGPGIPESEVTALRRRTEDQLDHTSGVGLWLATWIETALDGELRFPDDAAGSTVDILLPTPPPDGDG